MRTPEQGPTGGLTTTQRQEIEAYLRPLYAGLDGAPTFDPERLRERVESLRGRDTVDERQLELLVLLCGADSRIHRLAPDDRLTLLLRRVGIDPATVDRLRRGLTRLERAPDAIEERLVHDARLLDRMGVSAALEHLLLAGKKRWSVEKAIRTLPGGVEASRFATRAGAELARERQARLERWRREMEEALQTESASGAPRGSG